MTALSEVRAAGVARVAAALGLAVDARRGIRPCPACGADVRGSGDRRAAAVLTSDGLGFTCYRCAEKGDAITLASWRVCGAKLDAGDARWSGVREALAAAGFLDDGQRPGRAPARPLPPPVPMQAAPADPPPAAEVAALWAACIPVPEDPECAAWLDSRALDAGEVELHGLAKALPVGVPVPSWAKMRGAAWNASPNGYRLLVPLYDAAGRLASLHARALEPDAKPKGASPTGYRLRGLVMANPLARLLLAGAALGNGQPAAELVKRAGLVIAEGAPDFLTWASNYSDADEDAPAVVGIINGSWPADAHALAAKVPDGCAVTIATHVDPDGTGDRYAATIADSFRGRSVTLHRWAQGEGVADGRA